MKSTLFFYLFYLFVYFYFFHCFFLLLSDYFFPLLSYYFSLLSTTSPFFLNYNLFIVNVSAALKFGCKKMMGVDIDPNLIAEAKANLTKHLTKTSRPRSPVYSPFSTSFLPSSSSPSSSLSSSPSSSPSPSNTSKTSHNIQFISEDFISGTHQYEMFDTITWYFLMRSPFYFIFLKIFYSILFIYLCILFQF